MNTSSSDRRVAHGALRAAWWPAPITSFVLFVLWPVLNASASAAHLVLAAALAWAIPYFTRRLMADAPRLSRPAVMLRLAGVVLLDIVLSNIEVARRILGPESAIRPKFVLIPLDIRDPHGIVALASIITLTPGTLSADLNASRTHLSVHAFNVSDEAALVAAIKARYEAPLREIFE